MVDVSQASNDISLVGGPSIVNLVVDSGPAGQRGTQIYTGGGNPTDDNVFLPSIQINDLFINLNPASIDYLYLWQYASQDGVIAWRKILRLIPNTILVNPLIYFIDGVAHTKVFDGTQYLTVKGLFFPLAAFGETTDIQNLNPRDFNVQHNLISDRPTASTINLKAIRDKLDVEYLVSPGVYQTSTNFPFGQNVLYADMYATEFSGTPLSPSGVNGYKIVHMLATLGGKSQALLEFDANSNIISDAANTIRIPGHGLLTGQLVVYLKNPIGASISGLTDQTEYAVYRVDEDTIFLVDTSTSMQVDIAIGTATGIHVLGVIGAEN